MTRRSISLAPLLALTTAVAVVYQPASTNSGSANSGPASFQRLYAATSPFNQPIPADAKVDPNSEVMVRQLVAEVSNKGWVITSREYTVPIFYVGPKTPTHTVAVTAFGRKAYGVPLPRQAFPAPGTDRHMAVIDRKRGCEYDFFLARKRPDGSWQARLVNALSIRGSGVFPMGMGARASGFAAAGGLIMADELAAGSIDHALAFSMHETKAGGPVRPATSSDGWSTSPSAIPEGARLQLDPSLNLDSLPLAPWQRVVARAVQQYGMYLADTGGAVGLYAQHARTIGSRRYPWGSTGYAYMPSWLAESLRVLRLPRQQPSVHELVRTPCLRIR